MPRYTWAGQDKQPVKKRITLVCVTEQYGCHTHIKAGRALADLDGTDLIVIHVGSQAGSGNADALEYLYRVARRSGAAMQVLYDENPAKALIKFIKRTQIKNIVTGIPESGDSVALQLWGKFTHISFFTADAAGNLSAVVSPQQKAKEAMPQAALSSC